MTLEGLLFRLSDELARAGGRVEVPSFLAAFHPYDVEAGRLLARGFDVGLVRGWLVDRLVGFEGEVIAVSRPAWH